MAEQSDVGGDPRQRDAQVRPENHADALRDAAVHTVPARPRRFHARRVGNVYAKDFVTQCKRGHRYGDESDLRPIWAEEIGTRAHAIAQCVAFDGYLTTLCDWPERYRGADGIEALRRLPTTWRSTTPVSGKCGAMHKGVVYRYLCNTTPEPVIVRVELPGQGVVAVSLDAYELRAYRCE